MGWKNNQCKEDREEEASLILVLRVCAGDVDNMDTTKLTVPPIHGNSHLRGGGGGRVGSSPPRAVYTCVNLNYASHLPLSGKFEKTIGLLGQMQSQ